MTQSFIHFCSALSTDPECPEADASVLIVGPTMEDMFLNKKGKIDCRVQVNVPSLRKIWWEDQNGNELVSSTTTPFKENNSILSLPLDITFDEWSQGITRYCFVEHEKWMEPVKKLYERNIGKKTIVHKCVIGDVMICFWKCFVSAAFVCSRRPNCCLILAGETQRPSVFMLSPVELTRKDTVTLTCYVKDFFPQEVFVSWLVDDQALDSKYQFRTTNAVENRGTYSAYSSLMVPSSEWDKKDLVYSCLVYHESLTNTTSPIVRSTGCTASQSFASINMNTSEMCKAQ